MPTDTPPSRFRLRRARFPCTRPRNAPSGYVEGVGWLAPGLLWVDGWLTLDPAPELGTSFILGGQRLCRQAKCFAGPRFLVKDTLAARRWIVVIPVGDGFSSASRLRALCLATRWGDLLWLGGCDRFVRADVAERLMNPHLPSAQLDRLRSFVDGALRAYGVDADHPEVRRNLSAWPQPTEPTAAPPPASDLQEADVRSSLRLGDRPDEPTVSVIITLLEPPDLLEHHFVHQRRNRGDLTCETIFVVGPEVTRGDLHSRVRALSDLYGAGGLLLELDRRSTWASAAGLAAGHARGEILAFYRENTFSFEATGLASLIRPLCDRPSVGITAPVIRNFDGSIRSRGFRIASNSRSGAELEPISTISSGESHSPAMEACGPECFAIRRRLFDELGGFSQTFAHDVFESIDLCLRAAAAGWSVDGAPGSVRRFAESPQSSPMALAGPATRPDYEVLHRRHLTRWAPPPGRGGARSHASDPEVTVVIPTLNPGSDLAEVFDRLEDQKDATPARILVIDSSSSDGTHELLERRGIEHLIIERRDFNHGSTRNLGVQQASGDIVAFLSQDSIPEPGWLAALVAPFRDRGIGGAYSRQVPRRDASPFSMERLARWPAAAPELRRQYLPSLQAFGAMSLAKRLETICFDNVSSAVRRSVALEIPFRDLPFGEDRDWAYRVMAAGYGLEYRSDSVVRHSHERSAWHDLLRTIVDHRLIHDALCTCDASFDDTANGQTLSRLWKEVFRHLDVASRSPTLWGRMRCRARAPGLAVASTLGSHLGARISHLSASGSRRWNWIGQLLAE